MFGRKRALIEYVLLSGVNDTRRCAHELGALLQGKSMVVNLIPYNATLVEGDAFKEPIEEDIVAFKDIVMTYGLFVTVRRHHGRDIDGACGQLVLKTEAERAAGLASTSAQQGCGGTDIEDIGRAKPQAGKRTKQSTAANAGAPTKSKGRTKAKLAAAAAQNGADAAAGGSDGDGKGGGGGGAGAAAGDGSAAAGAAAAVPPASTASSAAGPRSRGSSGADAGGVLSGVTTERAVKYLLIGGAVAAGALIVFGVRLRAQGVRR
eukprot:TRINITY_DN3209_c0_g1_i1.p2 TRINITY_DN3209_c0_g1~~TRINITY_DN3209_c0_g1_i1.p2  ORF type:complete len:263 (-),score=110.37 TRINITY_DN3209_c0_g1_i1:64-852(-)